MLGYSREEIEKLIGKLEFGKKTSTRIYAAYELGYTGSSKAIPALRKAYNNDKSSDVRSASLWSIAELNVVKVKKLLHNSLYDEDWGVRDESISIILYFELKEFIDELSYLLYDDEDFDVKANAAFTLGEFKAKGKLNDLIHSLKEDESKKVRANAAEAIGKINPENKNALKQLKNYIINDNNYEVRSSCAIALANIESEKIKNLLLKVLKNDRSSLVRVKILNILSSFSEIDELEFLDILRDVIQTDPNSNVRNKAVELFGEREAKDDLHKILRNVADYDIILNVREQLERIADEQGYADVREMMSEMENEEIDFETRLAIIKPIEIQERIKKILSFPIDENNADEIFDALIDIMNNDDFEEFRKAAAQRLSVIRNELLENRLLQILVENEYSEIRISALSVLRNMGSEKILDEVKEIVQDENNIYLKELAIEAILNIDAKNNIDLLYECLNQKIDPNILSRIINSLYLIDKTGIKPKLIKLVRNHKSAIVRSSAIDLIKNYPTKDIIDILLKSKYQDRSLNTRNVSAKVIDDISQIEAELVKIRTMDYNKKQQELENEQVVIDDIFSIERNEKLTILFAAANPEDSDYLRQSYEIKQIMNVLRESGLKGKFNIKQEWAMTKKDLSRILFEYNPDILHISCHGTFDGSLLLEDKKGQSKSVSMNEIVNIFKIFREEELDFKLKLLVISACNSELLANEISKYIDFVVAMLDTITDESATEFASQFYEKICLGRSIRTAFRVGCNFIAENEEDKIPDLFSRIISSQGRFIFEK